MRLKQCYETVEPMAKVTIDGIPRLKGAIKDLFDSVRKDQQMLLEIGDKTVEQTKAFNRAGKSPNGTRHTKLETSTIESKKRLSKTNKTSEFYRDGFSNLTFTGQLIDAIKLKNIDRENSSVIIVAEGQRQPYKNSKGKVTQKARDNTPTNEKLVEYLRDMKRFVFGINKQIENNINKIVRKYLNQKIKDTFNKK